MRYEMRLTAYDVMDLVHISLTVSETHGPSDAATSTALHMITTARGRGLDDPRTWALEVLRTCDFHLSEKPPSVKSWGLPSGGDYTISGVAAPVENDKNRRRGVGRQGKSRSARKGSAQQ